MHVNTSKESLTITYDDNTGSFTTHAHNLKKIDYLRDSFLDARNHSILPNQDIGHLFHHLNFSAQKPDSLSPSKELVRFLMELTNRNNKTLTNLALLFANIASPEILTPKLFLLTTNAKECTCPLKEYFPFLLEHIFSPTEMPGFFIPFQTLGELTQKKHIYTMTNNLSMETKLITVEQGTSRLSDTQLSCIRKYVKGSKMSVSDKKCGSIFFRNTSPVICFVNNQKDLSFIEHNLPCIRIDLDHIEDSTCLPTRELFSSSSACEWLRLCLPLYGIYLLAEKKYHHTHLPKEVHLRSSSQEDTIIQEFINVCCTRSADVFIYTDELYNAYTFYYKTKHKSTPLKRTQFVTELKRIPNLTYKRPHFSRSEPNKYAFMGICLKTNWESSLSSSDENLSLEEEDFMKKLNKITELIPNTLTNHLKSI